MTVFTEELVWIVEVGLSSLTVLCMVGILASYHCCLKNRLSFAFQILMVLFINELGASVSRLLRFFNMDSVALCCLSLILSTGFDVSASMLGANLDIWTCFISRVVVKESNQPGRFINIWRVMARNILLTYVPAVCICVMIGVLLELDSLKASSTECWRTLSNRTIYDYIIYAGAFIVPNLIVAVVNTVCLYRYCRTKYQHFNTFLLFPLVQVLCAAYYIVIKIYLMFAGESAFEYSEIIYLSEPLVYSLLYGMLILAELNNDSSDTTSIISDRLRTNSTDYY